MVGSLLSFADLLGPSRVGGSAGGPSIGTSFAWVELETRVREGLGMQDGTVILIVPGGAG